MTVIGCVIWEGECMVNNTISQDEFNVFMGISNETKVKVMELYLIEGYTMNDVGYEVFGKDDRSFTVSLIHRCYNFSGRNGGKYRKGCKFQLEHNYIVSRNDIEEFIKIYPRGTFGNGITFDWNILKDLKGQKFILAGGLSKENIANALEYSPTILDVNSRVEVGDRKNKGLVEEIINLIGGDIFE